MSRNPLQFASPTACLESTLSLAQTAAYLHVSDETTYNRMRYSTLHNLAEAYETDRDRTSSFRLGGIESMVALSMPA
jgi:hypothetical protein